MIWGGRTVDSASDVFARGLVGLIWSADGALARRRSSAVVPESPAPTMTDAERRYHESNQWGR